jgi:uncharacterized protein
MNEEAGFTGESAGNGRQAREWAMFLHLSLLLGSVLPLIGLAAPIIIWQMKKDELPGIDEHGKNAMNWIVSLVIYFAIGFALSLLLIGIPILVLLAALSVIFPIIAGVKANNGQIWKYPMALHFIK